MDLPLLFHGYLGQRVHLGVSGSVAAYKAVDLVRGLIRLGICVSATLTRGALEFIRPLSFEAAGASPVHAPDAFFRGPGFPHLEPGKTAQALVVAPATANILAKLAHGLADDLLSCQALAFQGPILLAPAMNPAMWNAAATRENWARLLARGCTGIGPGTGAVACGDAGEGRLSGIEDIAAYVCRAVSPQDLAGRRVLVTLGPTREPWDAARHLSNPSSGLMGGCLAYAAWLRGAKVSVVAGPTSLRFVDDIVVTRVTTAAEMHEAVLGLWPKADVGCFVAAVSDFRPEPYAKGKLKKDAAPKGGLSLRLVPNPDILLAAGRAKRKRQKLIGFAAEASDLLAAAKKKLAAKNLDILVANRIDAPNAGFEVPTNEVLVLDRAGRVERWPILPKNEVAWRLWDLLLQL